MFCIAAFIVLALISIFSVKYRKLAKKAWGCTLHRITFRPCDTSFKEETKSKLLSHVANRTPGLVQLADIGIEIASFILVTLTVWSLLVALESGLNIFVWGTCTPNNASSCSLTSETCSIETNQKGFWQLTTEGKPWRWFIDKGNFLAETIANIPMRLKTWNATDYLPQNATYYQKFDKSKMTAIEAIDPGCVVCRNLFKNIKTAGFESKYNLTYIAYPIEQAGKSGQYKFKNSYIITTYLEALKMNPFDRAKTPSDWLIIEKIFTENDSDGVSYQIKFNSFLDSNQTRTLLKKWIIEIGYSEEQLEKIIADANSDAVKHIIADNKKIVEEEINTLKIPTIIFNGQRRDGLVDVNDLK